MITGSGGAKVAEHAPQQGGDLLCFVVGEAVEERGGDAAEDGRQPRRQSAAVVGQRDDDGPPVLGVPLRKLTV